MEEDYFWDFVLIHTESLPAPASHHRRHVDLAQGGGQIRR